MKMWEIWGKSDTHHRHYYVEANRVEDSIRSALHQMVDSWHFYNPDGSAIIQVTSVKEMTEKDKQRKKEDDEENKRQEYYAGW